MRTTIDLPKELLQQAKVAAAERGIPLRELVSKGDPSCWPSPSSSKRRKTSPREAPYLWSRQTGTLQITSADLANAEAEEDLRGMASLVDSGPGSNRLEFEKIAPCEPPELRRHGLASSVTPASA